MVPLELLFVRTLLLRCLFHNQLPLATYLRKVASAAQDLQQLLESGIVHPLPREDVRAES